MAITEENAHFGRIGIINVTPQSKEHGYAPRVELGEDFLVTAQVFTESRSPVAAEVELRAPDGTVAARVPMTCENPGLDYFTAHLQAGAPSSALPWEPEFADIRRQLGTWSFTVRGWENPYALWLRDAKIKVSVGDDVPNALAAGVALLDHWARAKDAHLSAEDRAYVRSVAATLRDQSIAPADRMTAADADRLHALNATNPLRRNTAHSQPQALTVERPHSSFTAWYQFFPRSEGAHWSDAEQKIIPGTLKTAVSGLERAKAEGFDVVYLPPISPIGHSYRKGRNNAICAAPGDPGSPWAIGNEDGGHDAVDPALGTMEDFTAFCARAHELGLEVALDFALQCSPDHPWVKQHPNWFHHKPDGSIAYAENPPKKYQDIYPIYFDADMGGIEEEVIRILEVWVKAGVTIFRVDNPHTKPVVFWQHVISKMKERHPEVLYLAEAFTRPPMQRALAYAGFTQSHCYFLWRNTKEELTEFLPQVNGEGGYYAHSTFWPTTPDNLTPYLQHNGIAGHAIRAILAALGSPTWGIYNGYELVESTACPNADEHIDNEKYEVKARDWSQADRYGIALLLTCLNAIRRAHPCTRSFHNLAMHKSDNGNILVFSRYTPAELTGTGSPDCLIVAVNLDGHNAQESAVHLDLSKIGLAPDAHFTVHDELTGRSFEWGAEDFVALAPWADVAHILRVEYPCK